MACHRGKQRSSCCFWDWVQVLHFRLFCWPRWLLSFKGFLLTVVDIMSSELNSPIPVHFSLLIPKMSMFTLAISFFDHFWFALIHGPKIPGFYAILLFTASDCISITSHIHNWVLFLLWLHLFILSGVISPLISRSILGIYRPGEFIFQRPSFSVLSFCLLLLFMGFSRQEYWSGLPFDSPVNTHMWVNMSVDRLTLIPFEVFFSFTFLKVRFHFLLTYIVSYIKYAIPVFVSLYVFFLGFVIAFKFLSVVLNNFTVICLGFIFFMLLVLEYLKLVGSLSLLILYFDKLLLEFFVSAKLFSPLFFHCRDPNYTNIIRLEIVSEFTGIFLILCFYFCFLFWIISIIVLSRSLIFSSAITNLLLVAYSGIFRHL